MIDLGIEQFNVEVDPLLLGIGCNAAQAIGAGFDRFNLTLMGLAVAAKAD